MPSGFFYVGFEIDPVLRAPVNYRFPAAPAGHDPFPPYVDVWFMLGGTQTDTTHMIRSFLTVSLEVVLPRSTSIGTVRLPDLIRTTYTSQVLRLQHQKENQSLQGGRKQILLIRKLHKSLCMHSRRQANRNNHNRNSVFVIRPAEKIKQFLQFSQFLSFLVQIKYTISIKTKTPYRQTFFPALCFSYQVYSNYSMLSFKLTIYTAKNDCNSTQLGIS